MPLRDPLSPAERSMRSRIGAHKLHSLYDSTELTHAARAKFLDRFVDEVDPDRVLPEAERDRRAEHARKAYFAALALKSAQARRAKRVAESRNAQGLPSTVEDVPTLQRVAALVREGGQG